MTDADDLLAKGTAARNEMLGTEFGQDRLDAATDFNRDFEELMSRYCFGEVWARPGLSRSQRSLITVAMLVALGRSHEIAIHVRGSIANGVSVEEIREILIHASIYCGLPAAVSGFRAATDELEAMGLL